MVMKDANSSLFRPIHPIISSYALINGTQIDENEESIVSNDASTAIGAFILGMVFLVGVPGNLFIIWSILARARRRSVTTIIILNLACADAFLMALTIFFVIYLAKQSWMFGNAMCKAVFYLCNMNMYASVFLITLMSLHRFVAVVWPRKVHSLANKKTVLRVIAGLWILVMFTSIPAMVFREVREEDTDDQTRLVCSPNHTLPRHVRFQYAFETVAGFILPFTIIVTSYVCILRRLRQTKFRRQVRSEKLILAIVVTFGLFWLPYHVINMIQVAAEWYGDESPTRKQLEHIWKTSRAVTSALAFISSCANPILYTFAGRTYMRVDGLAFMARLFEGTALDPSAKKRRFTRKEKEIAEIKDDELTSTCSDEVNTAMNGTLNDYYIKDSKAQDKT